MDQCPVHACSTSSCVSLVLLSYFCLQPPLIIQQRQEIINLYAIVILSHLII